MKKRNITLPLLGSLALLMAVLAYFFLLMPAMEGPLGETFLGYDFIFGNGASHVASQTPSVVLFVVLLVATLFLAFSLAMSFGNGGKRFAGFLYLISGVLLLVPTVLSFLWAPLAGSFLGEAVVSLSYGSYVVGGSLALGFLLSLVAGILPFRGKKKAK